MKLSRQQKTFKNLCVGFVTLFMATAIIVSSCGLTRAEIEAKNAELAKEGVQPSIKDLKILESHEGYYLGEIKIVKIDSCEYIIYQSHNIIHKENCKNPDHK